MEGDKRKTPQIFENGQINHILGYFSSKNGRIKLTVLVIPLKELVYFLEKSRTSRNPTG